MYLLNLSAYEIQNFWLLMLEIVKINDSVSLGVSERLTKRVVCKSFYSNSVFLGFTCQT